MIISQMTIENLSTEEYSHFLAYGEPCVKEAEEIPYDWDNFNYDSSDKNCSVQWISTLDSTTYPDMTFGYHELHCMSTVV